MNLVEDVRAGNRLALSRLLTQIENGLPEGQAALNSLFPDTGRAHLIGVTGAPGTGKSSLVNQIARYYRTINGEPQKRVAIVAVDPSSPFTGGAILGDRIRMRDLSGDNGIFIRSMASRGALGGLAQTTAGIVQAFDAAGYEIVLIETVGAGQAEVDIARLAHTTLVVEAPGLGDDIQAIKAGILEIADILVINKADRPGGEGTERALKNMLQLAHPAPRIFRHHGTLERMNAVETKVDPTEAIWIPPIQRTVATDGQGIEALGELIERHRQHLKHSGDWQRRDRARLQAEFDNLLQTALLTRWQESVTREAYQQMIDELAARRLSPYEAVRSMLNGGVRR